MASEKKRSPQETADILSRALKENTSALNSLRKRYRWFVFVFIMSVGALGYTAWSDHVEEIQRCESGNELRHDIDVKFQSISDALSQFVVDPDENIQEFLELLGSPLPPRDCSDIGWP